MKYGLIGKDVQFSFSKFIHEYISKIEYELISIKDEESFLLFLKSDFNGVNITIPYKTIAYENCDFLSEEAKATKTVNTIIKTDGKLYGYNTDTYGFKYLIDSSYINLRNKRILILGTGATSRSIDYILQKKGLHTNIFASRNPINNFSYSYDSENIKNSQIIINSTPVGSYPNNNEYLLKLDEFKSLESYIDVIYNPYSTRMADQARKQGCKSIGGLKMLIAQAVKSNELFLNTKHISNIEQQIYNFIITNKLNIILIGHPYSGKTTVGKELAKSLSMNFIDTDEIIEKQENASIRNIFSNKGISYFRNIEKNIIKNINSTGNVISLGGGSVLDNENMNKLLQNSIIISLKRDINLIEFDHSRPLADSKEKLTKIIKERENIYKEYANFEIDNSDTIQQTILKIKELL